MEQNRAIYYHERTKHLPWRYARSLGYLDWDTQPNPFRFWEGAEVVKLPLLPDPKHPVEALYNYNLAEEAPFTLNHLSKFLELALGLSAWKSAGGSRWAVRMNPSSGNLHPTECYLILPDVDGLKGVFHYNPFLHALELIRPLPEGLSLELKNLLRGGFIAVLTSIPWRESWKYGERALRYCLLDTGHAIGTLRFSASLKGWKVKWLNALGDDELTTLLGFDKVEFPQGEEEFPELALAVFPKSVPDVERDIPPSLIGEFKKLPFYGKPNVLSPDRVIWEIIYETLEGIKKPRTSPVRFTYGNPPLRDYPPYKAPYAEWVIRNRRSGHIYDPSVWISKELFLKILNRTLPRNDFSPFDVEISPTYISLVLFVHRVEGLPKGLYTYIRNEKHLNLYKERFKKEFLWEEVEENLFLLMEGDTERIAAYLSCMQDIASDGAFAVAMLSEFRPVVEKAPWLYKNIHWEAGLIGQVLYLEATAHGIKGTGIGCFFDDLTHEVLGLAKIGMPLSGNLLETKIETDRDLQVVYHFTVGGAYEDPRIETEPPYAHLSNR